MSQFRYSIKDLENFTKIKAHTIRIWEQRYGLLKPKRTSTNIRYYSEDDLKKILNINLLYSNGQKISKIALLNDAEIIEHSKALILNEKSYKQSDIDSLTLNIIQYKGEEIKKFLKEKLDEFKMEYLYEDTIIPILQKIGMLWQVNSINIMQEHYFTIIFREFIVSKIDDIEPPSNDLKTAMLFLHDNEEHEFSILLYQYILKQHGYLCHNFGQKVPIKEVETAFSQIKPKIVITTFTAQISEKNFSKVEKILVKLSKNSQVVVSGNQLDNLDHKLSKDLLHIKTISQFKTLLN